MFKTFLSVAKFQFIRSLEFRSEILLWIAIDLLPFLVVMAVFSKIFGNNTINGVNVNIALEYFLLVFFIAGASDVHFEDWRSQEIRNGKIDFYLIRPFSYIQEIIYQEIGSRAFYLSIFLPVFALLTWIISQTVQLSWLTASPLNLIWFFCLLVCGFVINLMISMIITLGTFWLEGSNGLTHFKWISIALLSGTMLPIPLMPHWLQQITFLLPLKYLYYVPISYIQGNYQWQMIDTLYLSLFVVGLLIANFLMWDKAKYKYSSAGG